MLFTEMTDKIQEIELFLINVDAETHLSYCSMQNRQHIFIRISDSNYSGWGEVSVSGNTPDYDINCWGRDFSSLKGMSLSDAFRHLKDNRGVWPFPKTESSEMALLDLAGKILKIPAIELLNLKGREPIPGLFCILENDPDRVAEKAVMAVERNLRSHVKLKIFGKTKQDCELVKAARSVLGNDTFLCADANSGYKEADLRILASQLNELHQAGLDACEDPAERSFEDWVTLQNMVGELALIPDDPTRPAWLAVDRILENMGRIYNLHPGCMGSIIELAPLANKIKNFNAALMIGDSSLVGPACTAWQQIAIGLKASWVEALEKHTESNVLAQCTLGQSTEQLADGRFAISELRPGFGLDLDITTLRALADKQLEVKGTGK